MVTIALKPVQQFRSVIRQFDQNFFKGVHDHFLTDTQQPIRIEYLPRPWYKVQEASSERLEQESYDLLLVFVRTVFWMSCKALRDLKMVF